MSAAVMRSPTRNVRDASTCSSAAKFFLTAASASASRFFWNGFKPRRGINLRGQRWTPARSTHQVAIDTSSSMLVHDSHWRTSAVSLADEPSSLALSPFAAARYSMTGMHSKR